MKSKNPFVAFNAYCLRTPSMPLHFLEQLWHTEDIETMLDRVLKKPLIKEAIYLASPTLFSQMELWTKGKIKDEKKRKRVEFSILKYLTRMSARCTPFGLFAGVSVGTIAKKTIIEREALENSARTTRYDMHFLAALAQKLAQHEPVKKQLTYYPNSTLYRLGDRYRYVEYTYEGKKRVHSIESVLHSIYLEKLLEIAEKGSKTSDLVAHLVHEGFEEEASLDFVEQLIANQILISELEPTVTGTDFLNVLRQKLVAMGNATQELELLNILNNHLKKLNGNHYQDLNLYKSINGHISSLKIDFEPQFLLQTDVYTKFKSNQLDQRILRKVKLGLWVLNKISDQRKNTHLERFKSAFNKRWEHQRVPLLKVMDIESGIGYGHSRVDATPFLDDIRLARANNKMQSTLSPFQELMFKKLQDCVRDGKQVLELEMKDLDAFEENWHNAPDTLTVMAEIVVQDGREKVVMDAAGAHAARLLGRFATDENDIGDLIKAVVQKEEARNKDTVLAEIVHIPESRTGNILRRPHIREYEIPCLGYSNLPLEKQIALQDILVSVDYGSINLTHALTGKKILPRLSNAHNYRNNPLPAYQFLCDLQYQEQEGYSFDWGGFMGEMDFLPRVVYNDIILAKRKWKLTSSQIKELQNSIDNDIDLNQKVNSWRKDRGMPDHVQLVEGDNTLLINFKSNWSVALFVETTKNKEFFMVQEVLEDENPLVKQAGSSLKNEFVFAFYNNQTVPLN